MIAFRFLIADHPLCFRHLMVYKWLLMRRLSSDGPRPALSKLMARCISGGDMDDLRGMLLDPWQPSLIQDWDPSKGHVMGTLIKVRHCCPDVKKCHRA